MRGRRAWQQPEAKRSRLAAAEHLGEGRFDLVVADHQVAPNRGSSGTRAWRRCAWTTPGSSSWWSSTHSSTFGCSMRVMVPAALIAGRPGSAQPDRSSRAVPRRSAPSPRAARPRSGTGARRWGRPRSQPHGAGPLVRCEPVDAGSVESAGRPRRCPTSRVAEDRQSGSGSRRTICGGSISTVGLLLPWLRQAPSRPATTEARATLPVDVPRPAQGADLGPARPGGGGRRRASARPARC
jgi:hypothetical protein